MPDPTNDEKSRAAELTVALTGVERRFLSPEIAGVALQQRDDGGDGQQVVGYAAVYYDGTEKTEFELWPGVVERVMPGAFKRTLREADIRALFNHDPNLLLGRTGADTLALDSTNKGLRYQIRPGDTTVGRDVVEHIRRGDLEGSSFSFNVVDQRWRKEEDDDGHEIEVREILEVDLFDVGPVTFPAYEATTVGVRSADEARESYRAWKEVGRRAAAERIKCDRRRMELDELSLVELMGRLDRTITKMENY